MKNGTYIASLVATCIVIAVGLTIFYFQGAAQLDQQPEIGPNKILLPTDPSFSPLKNANKSFEAEVNVVPTQSPAITGRIQHNGKRIFRMEITQSGRLFETYETPEKSIYCQTSGCYYTDPKETKELFDTARLLYEENELQDLGRGLKKTREEPCGQTTCEVWESSSVVTDGALSKVLLEKGSGSIIFVEGIEQDNRYTLTYTYKPVEIILPVRVEELPDDISSQ